MHDDGMGALDPLQAAPDGRLQVSPFAQVAFDQVDDHLGVGFRGKAVALGPELPAQRRDSSRRCRSG